MASNTNPLTSHVLDTAVGRPAVGVSITLSKYEGNGWREISKKLTNTDGRVGNLISSEEFTPSRFKLTFDTLAYYESRGEKTFYPYIDVVFEIERPEEHYHVPILLSAYGYSTYRGS
ncbi:5-hydroxyisourate hydrolase [Orchesella cincta]|uniref:5-hydroxyisourate hydrolase n=1 Tax=Orchesella cincta TaxID=48709 RepID=A0A1D2M8H2_ORCCI|nr:5-hydroxyisourate hydrolase [Orchesella cincta]